MNATTTRFFEPTLTRFLLSDKTESGKVPIGSECSFFFDTFYDIGADIIENASYEIFYGKQDHNFVASYILKNNVFVHKRRLPKKVPVHQGRISEYSDTEYFGLLGGFPVLVVKMAQLRISNKHEHDQNSIRNLFLL